MTDEMKSFLVALLYGERLPFASREQDRARQKCRKLGLAAYGGWEGDKQLPNRWRITDAGKGALFNERR